MLLDAFYERYFPSLQKSEDLQEINSSLIYMSQFSKMPYFLPQQLLETLEENIFMHPTMNFKHFS